MIALKDKVTDVEIMIYNSLGQKVHKQKIFIGENNISLRGLSEGLYNCLILENNVQIKNYKIVIE